MPHGPKVSFTVSAARRMAHILSRASFSTLEVIYSEPPRAVALVSTCTEQCSSCHRAPTGDGPRFCCTVSAPATTERSPTLLWFEIGLVVFTGQRVQGEHTEAVVWYFRLSREAGGPDQASIYSRGFPVPPELQFPGLLAANGSGGHPTGNPGALHAFCAAQSGTPCPSAMTELYSSRPGFSSTTIGPVNGSQRPPYSKGRFTWELTQRSMYLGFVTP